MGAEGISYSLHLLITHLGGCREKKVCPGPSPTPLSALTLTVPRGVSPFPHIPPFHLDGGGDGSFQLLGSS